MVEEQSFTENGAPSLSTTNNARLDLFFKLVRDITEEDLIKKIDESWKEDPLDTLKIIFQSRDCRGGKGDRKPFLLSMEHIARRYTNWFLVNLNQISFFGRWLDYIELYDKVDSIRDFIVGIFVEQLIKDKEETSPTVSLAAKWFPGEEKKFDNGIRKAVCMKLFDIKKEKHFSSWHQMKLRKEYITPLRKKIEILETFMCEQKWSEIKYERVPGVAMTDFKDSFRRHDLDRFEAYLDDVKNNKSKINATTVYPHTLVEKYFYNYDNKYPDDVIEEQWKVLEKTISMDDATVVADVSRSMEGLPMLVSIALGILISSNNKSPNFKNQLITFHTNPQYIDISDCETLYDKVKKVENMPWGGSTNFEKVFELILNKCLLNGDLPPSKVIVLSDMQFNVASGYTTYKPNNTTFENIKKKFKQYNLPFPEMIFWNLRGDTGDFPVNSSTEGVTMLSGFSQTLLNSIMSGRTLTPYNILRQIIDNPRYSSIKTPF